MSNDGISSRFDVTALGELVIDMILPADPAPTRFTLRGPAGRPATLRRASPGSGCARRWSVASGLGTLATC